MKRLKVDIDDIAIAMESTVDLEESIWCLDTETGKVINIFRSVMDDVDEGDDDAINDYPEWMEDMAKDAEAVLNDDVGQFVEIPKISSPEEYDYMESFISGIKNENICNKLFGAIKGKGAFRRFKDSISEWPEIEKQWYEYRGEAIKKEILDWLESIGIEPKDIKEN